MRQKKLIAQCLFNGALCTDILENVTLTSVVEHCLDVDRQKYKLQNKYYNNEKY